MTRAKRQDAVRRVKLQNLANLGSEHRPAKEVRVPLRSDVSMTARSALDDYDRFVDANTAKT